MLSLHPDERPEFFAPLNEKVIKLTYIKFNAATAFKDFDPAIIAKALEEEEEEEEVEQEEQDDDGDSVVSINSGGK